MRLRQRLLGDNVDSNNMSINIEPYGEQGMAHSMSCRSGVLGTISKALS